MATRTGEPMERLASLLQLASPSLPVGGFTYSRGLETAVERGWVTDATEARVWIAGLLDEQVGRLDAPLVWRLHRAFEAGAREDAERWARFARAARETEELQREASQMGRALARWLVDLGLADRAEVAPPVRDAWLAVFALAGHRLGLDARTTVCGYAWSWLESSVQAAVKLVPLGQTDGQRILLALGGGLERLAEDALRVPDDAIGALAPGFALASALHETQHTRLFRS
ncbi:MAG TPA: urease accessory UreF family protein [Sandaracinaceae bacterium LLY-WYZ-13_1]|nr:urease accessory UreF family protein [Sandaracinaceae bacterium LLY-WYZ-13_1]